MALNKPTYDIQLLFRTFFRRSEYLIEEKE